MNSGRSWYAAEFLGVAVIMTSAFLNLPRLLMLGPLSAGAVLTLTLLTAGVLLLLAKPPKVASDLRVLITLAAVITGGMFVSGVMRGINLPGLQDSAVILGFLAFVLVFQGRHRRLAPSWKRMSTAVISACWVLTLSYGLLASQLGLGSKEYISPASLGMYMILGICLLLGKWGAGDGKSLWIVLVFAAVLVIGAARMPLGVALTLIALATLLKRSLRVKILGFALLIVLLIVLSWLVSGNDVLYAALFEGDRQLVIHGVRFNLSGRRYLFGVVWQSYLDAPFLGHGAGSAELVLSKNHDWITQPHNDYLRILHDYGITGLLLFVSVVWTMARALLRRWRAALSTHPNYTSIWYSADTIPVGSSLLILMALLFFMVTDNAITYHHIMFPSAVIIGHGLAMPPHSTAG